MAIASQPIQVDQKELERFGELPVIGDTAARILLPSAFPPAVITPAVFACFEKITASVATLKIPSAIVTIPVMRLSDIVFSPC
jgi:hypothetical protein